MGHVSLWDDNDNGIQLWLLGEATLTFAKTIAPAMETVSNNTEDI